jgi:acetyltransferase-like isoleucine patch superfamily enzyme
MLASFTCNEPPTTIGDKAIIGIYTYWHKDVPANSFFVGIPGQVKKELPAEYLKEFNEGLAKRRR